MKGWQEERGAKTPQKVGIFLDSRHLVGAGEPLPENECKNFDEDVYETTFTCPKEWNFVRSWPRFFCKFPLVHSLFSSSKSFQILRQNWCIASDTVFNPLLKDLGSFLIKSDSWLWSFWIYAIYILIKEVGFARCKISFHNLHARLKLFSSFWECSFRWG